MGHITLTSPKTRSNPTRKWQLLDFISLIFFGIVILFFLLIFTPLGDSLAASGNQALIKSNLADPKQRGGLIALIESGKYGKVVDVCVNGDVDYMPCEDPARNSVLSREMNFYRERQCPGVDQRECVWSLCPVGIGCRFSGPRVCIRIDRCKMKMGLLLTGGSGKIASQFLKVNKTIVDLVGVKVMKASENVRHKLSQITVAS